MPGWDALRSPNASPRFSISALSRKAGWARPRSAGRPGFSETGSLVRAEFADLDGAKGAVGGILDSTLRLHGLFAIWDEPAVRALTTLRNKRLEVPITTIDLGNDAAIEMGKGGLIKGIGAQKPYDQGSAIAEATIMSLTGARPPSWVALPGLSVTARNVIEAYQVIWHAPAAPALRRASRAR